MQGILNQFGITIGRRTYTSVAVYIVATAALYLMAKFGVTEFALEVKALQAAALGAAAGFLRAGVKNGKK